MTAETTDRTPEDRDLDEQASKLDDADKELVNSELEEAGIPDVLEGGKSDGNAPLP